MITKHQRTIATERFSNIYEEVVEKYFKTRGALASAIGTHTNVLNEQFRGNRQPGMTPEQIEKLLELTPINRKWLFGDDNEPIYIQNKTQTKTSDMETIDELLIRIEVLENHRNSIQRELDEARTENVMLKRRLGKKEVG